MTKLQAIIFDLDDTLYSERDYVLSGFQAVADWAAINLGIEAVKGYATLANLYFEGVRNNTFDRWLTLHAIDRSDLVPTLLDVYRQHIPKIEPFPEIVEILKTLAGSYQIGLVSDGYLAVQQRKWTALGLDAFFDAVVFSDSLGRENWKPSTAPFKLVLEQLNILPEFSVYIGDNPRKDFLGARQLGMQTIWFKRAMAEYGTLEPPGANYHPHLIAESLLQVLSSIDRLNL
ncbi:HAD family hydrolase [Chamaesiphon minutus]|uniref:Haloacid dehalogenase superfamily enzyme, subfamily IA n=1 Tax=Chamaesiphon minutus (strain ATCC 27169 / PCC 6605) TaxID=1173020 RepID=K9UMI5_CHAP6|nr:HAD family hydrolase [Chamaesiphon minutus]AFY95661.1 haloacid dehalogenase superfamily enzyme, subfamily IA [Chamaesiphon minutus PCC 6605]